MLRKIFGFSFLLAAIMPLSVQAEVVYNRGNSGDLNTLDTHKTSTVQEATVLRDMFEGLTEYDAKGNAIPGAAESWTVSGDGTVYTFKLRETGRWSNGDPVTADDFVYSFRRVADPKTGSKYSYFLYPIKNAEAINTSPADEETAKKENKTITPVESLGARAIDKYTLEVTLNAPTAYFIDMLTHQSMHPVHRGIIEKYGADWVKPEHIATNGPYAVSEFIPKSHIKLIKNKFYRDAGKLKIDVVNTFPIEDRATALKRFEAGEIDSYDEIPSEQMAYVREHFKGRYSIGPWIGTYYYNIRTDKKPFDNLKLRRALTLAIDRDYLAEKTWDGTMLPAYSLVPPGIDGYKSVYADYKTMSQLDREEEARKIMEELGHSAENPLRLEIRFNTSEDHKNTAVAMADMFKSIHVQCTLTNVDLKTHYDFLQSKGNFDLARSTWIADYKDPQTFLALTKTGTGNNYSQFSNAEVDALLDKAAVELDPAKRFEYLAQAEEIVLREVPVIPLLYQTSRNLVGKRLKGFEQNIMNVHPTKWMWIDEQAT